MTALTPEKLADWRRSAKACLTVEPDFAGWIVMLLTALDALEACGSKATSSALSEAERKVLDRCLAERVARDALPSIPMVSNAMPTPEFWEANAKLEAAHVAYEKALDELFALRAASKGKPE